MLHSHVINLEKNPKNIVLFNSFTMFSFSLCDASAFEDVLLAHLCPTDASGQQHLISSTLVFLTICHFYNKAHVQYYTCQK